MNDRRDQPAAGASSGPGDEDDVASVDQTAPEEQPASREDRRPPADAGFTERFVHAVTSQSLVVTVLAFVSAVVVGAIILAFSAEEVRDTLGYFFSRPTDLFSAAWTVVIEAYSALLSGSVGGVRPVSETLVAATPLILTGLAVALPFRAGLFNIGAEGQVIIGGAIAGLAGFTLTGLPAIVHLPLALLAGLVGGAAMGFIPGALKARTGAHEVITTIMLNNIAGFLLTWLLLTELFRRPDRSDPISKTIEESATLPLLFGSGNRVHAGLIVALLAGAAIWWLIERSAIGFEIRAVGANPTAATTAGMSVTRMIVLTMTLAGALAGLAGATQILGLTGRITPGFSAGVGFDGITVALLGRGNPWGVVGAGLLFGALEAGGLRMQATTGTPIDLIVVIQALIIVFIAAPALVRAIYRIRTEGGGTGAITQGWGA